MKTLLFLGTVAVIGLIWGRERMVAVRLHTELKALRHGNAGHAEARREHERLTRAQAGETGRAAAEFPVAKFPQPATEAPPRPSLVLGEWHAPATWKNRGQSTPIATIETALWAGAGGDLATMEKLLQLDDDVRAGAEALWARLPGTARANYPNAEQLLAAFATKSLPLGEAQLVWNHQPNDDEAWACLFVKNPDFVPSPAPVEPATPLTREEAIARAEALKERRAKEKRAPAGPANPATRALYLTLRRSDDGWKLVVSPGAVERIANELRGGN